MANAQWTTLRLCRFIVGILWLSSSSLTLAFSGPLMKISTLSRSGDKNSWSSRKHRGSLQSSKDGDQEMQSLMNSLKSRQAELEDAQATKGQQIRFANVESRVAVVLDDWVRRIAVDYPLIACGTASGSIYLVNLENGQVLGKTASPETSETIGKERLDHVLHQLYGQFDGGGTLAVAVRGDLLCAANRSGGMSLFRLIRNKDDSIQIIAQGTISEDQLVTTLQITTDHVIAGTDQGKILVYEVDELPLKITPEICWDLGKRIIMALDVNEELGLIAAATDSGAVELLSLEHTDDPIGSFTPPYDGNERRSQNTFPTCVSFVDCSVSPISKQERDVRDSSVAIVCGSNDGSMFLRHLSFDGPDVNVDNPFSEGNFQSLMPRHFAGVRCLASPARDLLVSGGLDGSLRIWDVKERRFLYQFMGYKVWLGSIWTDGLRLCSDGADNTVVLHDFTAGTKI